MPVIRTLGADLPAELIGPTYVHEHLIIDSPLVAEEMTHIHLPSVEEAVAEVQTCIDRGVRTMVDAMPAGSGRDPERLMRVSVTTGMRVVAATGLHTSRYYQDVGWVRAEMPEVLAERFIADIEEGIDRHDYLGDEIERSEFRAGVIKVATLMEDLTAQEERLFAAAAIAHKRTGAPILTHTEGGVGGLVQIETLLGLGVAPSRIALSHTDKVVDMGYHREMLSTGVFLCYDQALRGGSDLSNPTAQILRAMLEAGFGDQVLLGTDGARRSLWATLDGSPGLAWLYGGFADVLSSIDIADDRIEQMFTTNPIRFLTLRV